MSLLAQVSGNIIYNPALNPLVGNVSVASGQTVLQTFLTNFIVIAFVIGAIILVFMLITGGIQYISAGSDKEAVQNASKRLTHALIGLTILLSVYAILSLITQVFGINILQMNFPVIT